MDLAVWIRARAAWNGPNTADHASQAVEQRTIETVGNDSDTEVLSIARLAVIIVKPRCLHYDYDATYLHFVFPERLHGDQLVFTVHFSSIVNHSRDMLRHPWSKMVDNVGGHAVAG